MLAQHMVAAFLRDTIFLLIVQDVDNKGVAVTPRFLFTLEGFQMSQSLNFERADQIVSALKRRFATVGRNLALILKGSQMVAGGLTARAHPRSRSHAMFSIPEEIADCVCAPSRINNLACDNIRGCRFAQPPATLYNPYRGNEAMMREIICSSSRTIDTGLRAPSTSLSKPSRSSLRSPARAS
jgi:hypothetical protein